VCSRLIFCSVVQSDRPNEQGGGSGTDPMIGPSFSSVITALVEDGGHACL
jgi:hypothetical protein